MKCFRTQVTFINISSSTESTLHGPQLDHHPSSIHVRYFMDSKCVLGRSNKRHLSIFTMFCANIDAFSARKIHMEYIPFSFYWCKDTGNVLRFDHNIKSKDGLLTFVSIM